MQKYIGRVVEQGFNAWVKLQVSRITSTQISKADAETKERVRKRKAAKRDHIDAHAAKKVRTALGGRATACITAAAGSDDENAGEREDSDLEDEADDSSSGAYLYIVYCDAWELVKIGVSTATLDSLISRYQSNLGCVTTIQRYKITNGECYLPVSKTLTR